MNFQKHLLRQLRFIEVSCREYDGGNVDEAIRIGTALRVIFHHTNKSTSLLDHLGVDQLALLSSADTGTVGAMIMPTNTYLLLDPANKIYKCLPRLGRDGYNPRGWKDWWECEMIVLVDGKVFTRKDFVLWTANKDGGAHVDAVLPPEYEKVIDGLGNKMELKPVGGPNEVVDVAHMSLAPLRQMGFELLHSPEVLNLAGVDYSMPDTAER